MPRKVLVDLSEIDLEKIEYGPEEIRKVVPQRYEMEQLHGILKLDIKRKLTVGFRNVGDDEFWVRGHIPGRPLFPGVLMLETAAQLCTFHYKKVHTDDKFLGFGAVNDVKFRGTVEPGNQLIFVAVNTEVRKRFAMYETQAFVDGRLVFEAYITGVQI